MALGSAAVIMRAKLSFCSVECGWEGGGGCQDELDYKGSLFLSLYLCCLAPVQICAVHVLYLCFFLLRKAVLTTTPCFYFQNML